MLRNPWLDINLERLATEIDLAFAEVYKDGGTVGEFLDSLSKEQMNLLRSLTITDGGMDQQAGGEFILYAE